MSDHERTTLPSGVRVLTEQMPGATSVATGIWVGVGSRDEPEELAGASHFLEHLLFKGTERRSARSIAVAVDAVGGEMNAFTTREGTAFYTRLPVRELDFGLDLLVDVVGAPAFRPHEVDAEREVILEELLMAVDTPDDLVSIGLFESVFPDHPLGRETLGSQESVTAMGREAIATFHERWYRPANVVVAAAGDLEHDRVVEAVAELLADRPAGDAPARLDPSLDLEPLRVVRRPIEQVHVALGWRSLSVDDPDRYALAVANQVIGGGMSSRLFQEVREERGLAYTVYSGTSAYQDAGLFTVYAGTAPSRLGELVHVIEGVLQDVVSEGITAEEHRVAVGCLEGSTLLGLEDSASRMARLGGSELARRTVTPVEEHLARIRSVTRQDVARVVARVLGGPRAASIVGPVAEGDPAVSALAG